MAIKDVVRALNAYKCPLIEVTGGEPLLQPQTPELITALLDRGHTVLLETNGTFDLQAVDSRCVRIMDVKCPGSGEAEKTDFSNFDHLQAKDQIKFVLTHRQDYNYAKDLLLDRWPEGPPMAILFSPAEGWLDPAVCAAWILKDHLPVRLQLQLHKILWPAAERGV